MCVFWAYCCKTDWNEVYYVSHDSTNRSTSEYYVSNTMCLSYCTRRELYCYCIIFKYIYYYENGDIWYSCGRIFYLLYQQYYYYSIKIYWNKRKYLWRHVFLLLLVQKCSTSSMFYIPRRIQVLFDCKNNRIVLKWYKRHTTFKINSLHTSSRL